MGITTFADVKKIEHSLAELRSDQGPPTQRGNTSDGDKSPEKFTDDDEAGVNIGTSRRDKKGKRVRTLPRFAE